MSNFNFNRLSFVGTRVCFHLLRLTLYLFHLRRFLALNRQVPRVAFSQLFLTPVQRRLLLRLLALSEALQDDRDEKVHEHQGEQQRERVKIREGERACAAAVDGHAAGDVAVAAIVLPERDRLLAPRLRPRDIVPAKTAAVA